MPTRNKTLAELLAEQRDRPSPVLELHIPLLRLLDNALCADVSKKMRDVTGEWEVMMATERGADALPAKSGLYMFVWRPALRFHAPQRPDSFAYILYVGQAGGDPSSSTIKARYRTYTRHIAGPPDALWEERPVKTRDTMLERYLKLRPLEFWYMVIPDPHEVDLLEDQLIKLLSPPLNGQRTPKVRLTIPGPAFKRPGS